MAFGEPIGGKAIGLIFCGLLMSGCTPAPVPAPSSGGTPVYPLEIQHFRTGITTAGDVEATLGVPQVERRKGNGDTVLLYVYTRALPIPPRSSPFAGLPVDSTRLDTTRVAFEFDPTGYLLGAASARSATHCILGMCGVR
jgi:hypothetical protein